MKLKSEQKLKLQQENKLRRYIKRLIKEVEEASPHDSTGINVLEDLLKTIIPILSTGYKQLTSDVEQRQSFRAHVIRAVQNLLSTESIYFTANKQANQASNAQQLSEQEKAVQTPDIDDPVFIDINADKKKKEAEQSAQKPENAFTPIEGQDPTGRGFAAKSFDKIQKQIIDSYSLLGKQEDREIFYDYLITNLKLYFDMFEDELQKLLQEPTTQAYEDEKKKKLASLEPAEAVDAGEAAELGTEVPVDTDEEEVADEEAAAAEVPA